ncbi:aminotransferase class V-fold PLP-dependent enzyme [Candidatus Pelagibacter ubique]|nr:aminotransferase class V-fold PLP-dependent enzyme [Candidatus Pelagibacter ubique]
MKNLVKYPPNKKFKVRMRDLSVKDKRLISQFNFSVKRVLDHGIFILGEEVIKFEKKLARYIGVNYCVGTCSASSALYLVFKSLNFSKGSKIITTPMSWLVSSTSFYMLGLEPTFVDIDKNYNLDPDEIEKKITKKTKAILVVHFYGKVAQMDRIKKIAKKNKILLIEDAAQAFGTNYKNKKTGSWGDFGIFSFSPMKTFPSFGDCGAIVFRNKKYLEKLKSLRTCGTINREVCINPEIKHDMDAIQAGYLLDKFQFFDNLKKKRINLAKRYYRNLKEFEKEIFLPKIENEYNHSFYDFTIRVKNRQKVINFMYSKQIEVKVRHPILISDQPIFKNKNVKKENLPFARKIVDEILCLPMHYNLTFKQVDYVCKNLIFILKRLN